LTALLSWGKHFGILQSKANLTQMFRKSRNSHTLI
jgi:hypothetical protein